MRPAAQLASISSTDTSARHSEVTRLLCASVFLGHADEIRQKLRAHLLEGYHGVAENPGLNTRLLARVLDFFLARRLWYIAWHGPLGTLCLLSLGLLWITSPAGAQKSVAGALFALALAVFALPAYMRQVQSWRYALRSFARDTFDVPEAMARFASKPGSGPLERDLPPAEAAPNVSVFGGFDPFVGAGGSLGDWSLCIDTRKGKDGGVPLKLTAQELERAIAAAFRQLPIPDLRLGERLFVHGQDVALVPGLLPDRLDRPRQRVSEETLERLRQNETRHARLYQFVQLASWTDQVCLSSFYRATLRGPMLYIENHMRVLQPVSTRYWAVDDLVIPRAASRVGLFVGHVIVTPLLCIAECIRLLRLMSAMGQARKQQRELKQKVEEAARFNYGPTTSLRESLAVSLHSHFFEKSDRDLYQKALQKQLLDSIIDFLDARNVDTSELREQRTFMVNSGLIVHGNVQAEALAVGESARARSRAVPQTRAKAAAQTGVAAT